MTRTLNRPIAPEITASTYGEFTCTVPLLPPTAMLTLSQAPPIALIIRNASARKMPK